MGEGRFLRRAAASGAPVVSAQPPHGPPLRRRPVRAPARARRGRRLRAGGGAAGRARGRAARSRTRLLEARVTLGPACPVPLGLAARRQTARSGGRGRGADAFECALGPSDEGPPGLPLRAGGRGGGAVRARGEAALGHSVLAVPGRGVQRVGDDRPQVARLQGYCRPRAAAGREQRASQVRWAPSKCASEHSDAIQHRAPRRDTAQQHVQQSRPCLILTSCSAPA